MIIRRSHSNQLHCDSGLPAVDTPALKQWFVNDKLHRADGPAVMTPGGRMFFWRGIYISEKLWMECPKYTAKDILGIKNIELRRAVMEKVGLNKFIAMSRCINKGKGDFEGCELYALEVEDEQPPDNTVKFARLKNSTPEPDGTYKDYFLRVPPSVGTVEEAVKWSFGFSNKESMEYTIQT